MLRANVAKDVFTGGDDETNLLVFRRDEAGKIVELVERRKYNDLHMSREAGNALTLIRPSSQSVHAMRFNASR